MTSRSAPNLLLCPRHLCPPSVEPHPKRGPWEVRGKRGKIGSERAGELFKTHSLHGQGRRQEEGGDEDYREPAGLGERRTWRGRMGRQGRMKRAQGWRNRATHGSPVPLVQDMTHLDSLGCTHTCVSYTPPHQGHVIQRHNGVPGISSRAVPRPCCPPRLLCLQHTALLFRYHLTHSEMWPTFP